MPGFDLSVEPQPLSWCSPRCGPPGEGDRTVHFTRSPSLPLHQNRKNGTQIVRSVYHKQTRMLKFPFCAESFSPLVSLADFPMPVSQPLLPHEDGAMMEGLSRVWEGCQCIQRCG